jgi:hypothetical protein
VITYTTDELHFMVRSAIDQAVRLERERCTKIVEQYADAFNEGPHAKAWMRDAASCIRKGE